MSEGNHYNGAHLILAFLAGAAAGAVTALLASPQSGREVREKVKSFSKELPGKAEAVKQAARAAYGRASEAAKEAYAQARAESSGKNG